MVSGGGGDLRGLARRSSTSGVSDRPIPDGSLEKSNHTHNQGGSFDAPDAVSSKPVTALRQPRLPLSPLERVTFYDKRRVAEFLPFAGAISLMLASKELHDAIQDDPLLRLDEISASFRKLGCNGLLQSIQSLEADISILRQLLAPHEHVPESRWQLRSGMAVAASIPGPAMLGISFAQYCCNLHAARSAARLAQTTQRSTQAEVRAKEAQVALCAAALQPFESGFEEVVFHFASERIKGPRQGKAPDAARQEVQTPDVTAQELAHRHGLHGRLQNGLYKADVELVRAGMREFLSLPARLVPNDRKVIWLREAKGVGILQFFGRNRCGQLKEPEQRRYEVITAYVDEIVSSPVLTPSEKAQLCVNLGERGDIFRHALYHDNPAVAASVLLGILESSAGTELKQFLLGPVGDSWHGGLSGLMDGVIGLLGRSQPLAPDWVDGVIARLQSVKLRPPIAEVGGH
jgi:hypothetical protein